ncbi:uncharacterized protein [Solanum tuberosum]|uniref:uncharacterized protein n=1 Tax=Solanum tuberosum TaxID=4113 RepID=UPI00073A441C|nr:PREDICTED: uncharacterized protein LOC107062870 [Solanum tuberosum]
MYEEHDVDLDGAGATGAIVLPALPPGVKFTITSTMIQLLNLKVCGGSFMRKPFSESMQLMDEVSKNNRAWYTRDAEVGDLGYTFELLAEQRKREEERDQDMAQVGTSQGKDSMIGQQTESRETGRIEMGIEMTAVVHMFPQVLEQAGRGEDEADQVDDLEDAQEIAKPVGAKEKEVERTLPLQNIPRPPPHFPQRLKKKAEDRKFAKRRKNQVPGYAKFMKDLVNNKRVVTIDLTNHSHHYSATATRGQHKLDVAGHLQATGLGVPKPTTMRLMIADMSVKRPVGILCDILVKVDTFIFLAYFVILDCEVDFEVPIILERPFLATGQALVDVERGELKFRINNEEVFDEKEMGATIEERLTVETLAAVLMYFEADFWPGPPAKPSIEKPPMLELEQLPSHLRSKL